jgi:hypothetical protein
MPLGKFIELLIVLRKLYVDRVKEAASKRPVNQATVNCEVLQSVKCQTYAMV